MDNDREESNFLEEISNFESEILQNYFRLDDEIKQKFGGSTGALIITDQNGAIFYHERPAA